MSALPAPSSIRGHCVDNNNNNNNNNNSAVFGSPAQIYRERTCFFFDFTQDIEKGRLHSVTVESVFPETEKWLQIPTHAFHRPFR